MKIKSYILKLMVLPKSATFIVAAFVFTLSLDAKNMIAFNADVIHVAPPTTGTTATTGK